jgi:hypothetical protein
MVKQNKVTASQERLIRKLHIPNAGHGDQEFQPVQDFHGNDSEGFLTAVHRGCEHHGTRKGNCQVTHQ